MFKYGGTQIISTLEESLQKSNIICTTAQSVWSLGHGKTILLRTHIKFSTVLFTTHHYCWLFSGKWPHNCNESSAFKVTEFTVTTKKNIKILKKIPLLVSFSFCLSSCGKIPLYLDCRILKGYILTSF